MGDDVVLTTDDLNCPYGCKFMSCPCQHHARAEGAKVERARVLAWLKTYPLKPGDYGWRAPNQDAVFYVEDIIEALERGDHEREEG